MGIDISGGMLLGAKCTKVKLHPRYDCFYEMAEELEMEIFCEHYDADVEYQWVGYSIPDIEASKLDSEWLRLLKVKAKRFQEIFGVEPTLVGMQHVF